MNRWFFSAALELVVIVGRHGIRSPLQSPAQLAPYAAQPWPQWPEPPGYLTPRGAYESNQLGRYFRERYVAAGLLAGRPADDAPAITLRADSDERTVETARLLGEGLAGGVAVPVQARPAGTTDPLFGAAKLDIGHPDRRVAVAALLGRIGDDPEALLAAYRPQYERLQAILFPGGRIAPGKVPLLSLPTGVLPGAEFDAVRLTGPFFWGLRITDAFMLEYCDGHPPDQVGWDRVDGAELQRLLAVHSLYFDLTERTLACAQVNGSNLARHLIATIEQGARGAPVPGAVGRPGQKIAVLLGHDSNLINLAGLLDLNWILPGTQQDPVLPSGALVFELRRDDAGRQWLRVAYISPTIEQQHRGDALGLRHPPGDAPIYIPQCSTPSPGYDAPLEAVERKLNQVIDPRYVLPGSS